MGTLSAVIATQILREKKAYLESSIKQLVDKFKEETNANIESISIETMQFPNYFETKITTTVKI